MWQECYRIFYLFCAIVPPFYVPILWIWKKSFFYVNLELFLIFYSDCTLLLILKEKSSNVGIGGARFFWDSISVVNTKPTIGITLWYCTFQFCKMMVICYWQVFSHGLVHSKSLYFAYLYHILKTILLLYITGFLYYSWYYIC